MSTAQGSEVATCRICRCEATEDQPLFHPCKCRGSIKYIHQDCLQSWLEHSQKDTCDICHTKYQFLDLFDTDAPERPPFSLIFKQFIQKLLHFQYQVVKFGLMTFCVCIEVPFFLNSVDRITDWQLGIPVPEIGMTKGLIFGNFVPTENVLLNGSKIWDNTLSRGFIIGVLYFVIIGSMVLIQSSIVSDDGFKKIIHKKIGLDLKPSLQEVVNQRNRNLQNVMEAEVNNNPRINEALNGWLNEAGFPNENQGNPAEPFNHDENLEGADLTEGFENNRLHEENQEEDEEEERRLRHQAQMRRELMRQQQEERQRLLLERLQEIQQQQQRRQQQQQQQQQDEEDNEVNDFWAGPKNIAFIVQVTILANLVSCAVIITFKMIPAFIGLVSIGLFNSIIVKSLTFVFSKLTHTTSYLIWSSKILSLVAQTGVIEILKSIPDKSLAIKLSLEFIYENLINPMLEAYKNTSLWKPRDTLCDKLVILSFGYCSIGLVIGATMKRMESSCKPTNPLTGNYRSLYIILLQLTSVIKVFVLMAIEWAVFPFYSGFQIQLALVAFSSDSIYTAQLPKHLVLTDFLGIIPIWFMGTFFMYFFASFVGMIRKDIFRPGVLFFIRPSDDPNVRLIHDALMRPFGLKVSRILLSAGVYTLYIFVEIMMPLWSVRLFSPIQILPVHHKYLFETAMYLSLFIISRGFSDWFGQYWRWVFDFACAQMRLSSFLLNKDKPEERGRIVYRNIFAKLKGAKPDYSAPILKDQVSSFFAENPTALCAYIPDGNFVRAPDNDTASRKFVRTLFVPVTRSDKLLAPLPELPDDEHIFNPYDDEETLDSTTYTIVYRPPLFKTRIAGFFSILFAASMFFTFALYLINSVFKFTVSCILVGQNPFPNELYQIDPYSLMITLSLLSYHKFFETLFSINKENMGYSETVRHLREAITNFMNNGTVQFIASRAWLAFMIPTLIGLSNQQLIFAKQEMQWLPLLKIQVMIIPLAHALNKRISRPDEMKFYNYATLVFVVLRIGTLIYFTYGGGTESGNFVVDFTGVEFSKHPPIFLYAMRYFILNDPIGWEGKMFHSLWIMFSTFRLVMLASEYWEQITHEVKQKYYSSGQILTNVDINDDAENDEMFE